MIKDRGERRRMCVSNTVVRVSLVMEQRASSLAGFCFFINWQSWPFITSISSIIINVWCIICLGYTAAGKRGAILQRRSVTDSHLLLHLPISTSSQQRLWWKYFAFSRQKQQISAASLCLVKRCILKCDATEITHNTLWRWKNTILMTQDVNQMWKTQVDSDI